MIEFFFFLVKRKQVFGELKGGGRGSGGGADIEV